LYRLLLLFWYCTSLRIFCRRLPSRC